MGVYDFQTIVAIKIVVRRGDRVLLLREPETNDWMPGRLGLPGGKLLLHESINDGIKRKIATEIGFEVNIKGLQRVINILMPDKNVYHFIVLAEHLSGEIDTSPTEAKEIQWYTKEEIRKLEKNDFTEWYNDELLKTVLNQSYALFPLDNLVTQDNRIGAIQDWMHS